ncbi:MAG: hypothetical protein ABIH63_02755 [archaeon]
MASSDDPPPLEFIVNPSKVNSGDKVLQTFLEGDPDPVDYIVNSVKNAAKPPFQSYLKSVHSKFY